MDPDTAQLLTLTRSHMKALRRQLSVGARLLAELEDRFLEPEINGQPKEAHHDDTEAERP